MGSFGAILGSPELLWTSPGPFGPASDCTCFQRQRKKLKFSIGTQGQPGPGLASIPFNPASLNRPCNFSIGTQGQAWLPFRETQGTQDPLGAPRSFWGPRERAQEPVGELRPPPPPGDRSEGGASAGLFGRSPIREAREEPEGRPGGPGDSKSSRWDPH